VVSLPCLLGSPPVGQHCGSVGGVYCEEAGVKLNREPVYEGASSAQPHDGAGFLPLPSGE
jgi:hypothetical protein